MKTYLKAYSLAVICFGVALLCLYIKADGAEFFGRFAFAILGVIAAGFGVAGQFGSPRIRNWVDTSF